MKKTGFCPITKQEVPIENLVNARGIGDKIREMIVHTYPDWDAENGVISSDALNQFRAEYVKKILEEEKGELSKLEIEVLDRISNFGTISKNVDLEAEEELNLGQRLADKVAEFGGSWGFILSFAGFIFIWILTNVFFLTSKPFDPYPFILLNLLLSCLAAIQAPIIMMSQNRQETKDRLRSQHDYQINLKAELEIRQLHEKIDYLLIHQSQKLFEIQQIQLELTQQLIKDNGNKEEI
jgi:uncharacterized membrane protein